MQGLQGMGKEEGGERRGGEGVPSSDSGACGRLSTAPAPARVSFGLHMQTRPGLCLPGTEPARAGRFFQPHVWRGTGEGTFPRHRG